MFSAISNKVQDVYTRFTHPSTEQTDALAGKYTGSEDQQKLIKDKVNEFKNVSAKTIFLDEVAAGTISAELLLYAAGIIGALGMVIVTGLMGGYVFSYEHRVDIGTKMQAQLKELKQLYAVCLNSNLSNLIKDNTFLDLLEAIAPYSKTDDLHLEKLNLNASEIPQRFTEILSRAPHRLLFVMPEKQRIAEQIDNLTKYETQGWYGFYNQSTAQLKRLVYAPNLPLDLLKPPRLS